MSEDRIDALGTLLAPALRDRAGRHEYDGQLPDLSPDGVERALDSLGGAALEDAHDEAHLRTFEDQLRVDLGDLQTHRRSPRPLLEALDLSVYDRPYAPEQQREDARRAHLAGWPDAIDAGIEALDRVPAVVARGLRGSVAGVATGIEGLPGATQALAAHARLVAHLDHAAEHANADPAIGGPELARLLGASEACTVDLAQQEERADRERDRLVALLDEGVTPLADGRSTAQVVHDLVTDHPDADGVLRAARDLTADAIAFTRDHGLVTDRGGVCEVAPSPPSRRWATAMLSWAAPYEPDGPSWYFITPPDDAWDGERRREWLSAFSLTTLPSTTVHEVAPGHFTHGRALRDAPSAVRRTLHGPSFVEGWAHYAEELLLERGFRDHDPRFQIGVALKALLRVTRMAVAIGLHRGTMSVDEARHRFCEDAHLRGAVAQAETARATFDPTYGRYTWGKLEIVELRSAARRRWGAGFSLRRFHDALLELGSPPLGLMDAALDDAPPR